MVKGDVEREEEKMVFKRRCVTRVSSDVFDDFCPIDESESVGDSRAVFRCCVPAVLFVCACCFPLDCVCA